MPSLILEPHGVGEAHPPFDTLTEMFDHAVMEAPQTNALIQDIRMLSYQKLDMAVRGMAGELAAAGATGNTVGLLLPNGIGFTLAYFATLFAGGTPTLLNPAYPPAQLKPILQDADPAILISTPQTGETLDALSDIVGDAHRIILEASDPEMDAYIARSGSAGNLPRITPDTPAALLYTGGTTGVSKGVEHTHAMLTDAVRAIDWVWPAKTSGEVRLPVAPMFHIYGFLTGVLNPVYDRCTVVIPDAFKPDHVVDLMARYKVTIFGGGPPAIYAALLNQSNFQGADLSALRVCPAGGAPFPVELIDRWRDATGITIQEGYGMTEMAPISGNTEAFGSKPGTVGLAIPGCKVQIVDLEDKDKIMPADEKGEIRIAGPFAMTGYRNRPDETAKTIHDGFIYTGDIGVMDADGIVSITDRKKDVIIVNGFNVFPRDIEELVFTNPNVRNVGVIGMPDERAGERVVVFIVADHPEETEAAIVTLCEDGLAPYQRPSDIRFVDDLPITPANKLDRVALREIAAG